MKRKLFVLTTLLLLGVSVNCFAAWTCTPSAYSEYGDDAGKHFVLKLACTSDGSAGSYVFNKTNLGSATFEKMRDRVLYTVFCDPVGTLAAAGLDLTITNGIGAEIFTEAATFTVDSTEMVLGNVSAGQYPHFFDDWTNTFTDVGDSGDQLILYYDFMR